MTTDPNDPSRPQVPPAGSPPPLTPPAATPHASTPPASAPPAGGGPATPPMPQFDRSKLSTGDLIFCGGTVLYLISMVFAWASVDVGVGVGSISINGFDIGRIVFALVLLLVGAVLVALPALGQNIALPVPRSLILVVITAVVVVITFTAFIDIVTDDFVSTGFGTWLGMLVALGLLAQAVLTFRQDRGRTTV